MYQPVYDDNEDKIALLVGGDSVPASLFLNDSDTPVAADGSVTISLCFSRPTNFGYLVTEE